MNVLSLFDGMSCGQLALEKAGISVENYYSSEIDKYAIKVTQANFPKTIQLGDINDYKKWNLPKIDLILAGSPCQGFSIAGKQLNFNDSRSALFFKFVEILKFYKPKYFLLENVKMKKEYEQVITDILGVNPILLNSSLVSAQNRERLYWFNFPMGTEIKNKNIYLKDILDNTIDHQVLKLNDNKRWKIVTENERGFRPHRGDLKATGISELGRILKLCAKKTDTLTTNHAPKVVVNCENKKNLLYRKLTPLECERLQTVPENYTNHASNTQRYKMLGNGWTIEIIAHILKGIKDA